MSDLTVGPLWPASYRSLEAAQLSELPLSRLAADGALVAVWCTNSAVHRRTLRHHLLPAWGVTELALWHWVKVSWTPLPPPPPYGRQDPSGSHVEGVLGS